MIVIGKAMMVMLPNPGGSRSTGKTEMIMHKLEPRRIERWTIAVA